MGRKRNRTRKYLYFFIACMIVMAIAGCATLKEMEARREARGYLTTAQELLEQGDYEGSLQENQKVLLLYHNIPPEDKALFNIGLIYAHYGYAKRDYGKSLEHFKRVVEIFPQSPFVPPSRIWMGILQENERLIRENEESKKSLKELRQENERLKREIEELNKTIKKSKQVDIEIDEKKKELSK